MTRSHEGSGLGLSIPKRHTEFHDGSLDIESEVGVGTTITMRFPPEKTVASQERNSLHFKPIAAPFLYPRQNDGLNRTSTVNSSSRPSNMPAAKSHLAASGRG